MMRYMYMQSPVGRLLLAGTSKASILAAWDELQHSPRQATVPPLWDGQAGERSRNVLRQVYVERAKEEQGRGATP